MAGAIGLFESNEALGEARARQEEAQTQAELSLATYDSVFATLGIGGSLFATSAGIRGVAAASVAMTIPSRAYTELSHVRANGTPPAGYKGGRVFRNREGRLPGNGNYREYDIDPAPAAGARNAERIVVDEISGNAWYTSDHYLTFKPM